jgi:hypothetical protein
MPDTFALPLPRTIAKWRRNGRQEIAVTLDRYNGRFIVDLRVWYADAATGELRPGKPGLTLDVAHLPTLAKAFPDALAQARAMGLLDPERQQPQPRTPAPAATTAPAEPRRAPKDATAAERQRRRRQRQRENETEIENETVTP